MKSLYETILQSTKSGINAPLTLDYLVKRGYEFMDGMRKDDTLICKKGTTTTHVLHYKDLNGTTYIWIRLYINAKFYPKWVATIKDLELVEALWTCNENNDKTGQKKNRNEIMKKFYDIPSALQE